MIELLENVRQEEEEVVLVGDGAKLCICSVRWFDATLACLPQQLTRAS